MQVNDPLVGAAAKQKFRVSLFLDERTVHKYVQIWQDLRQFAAFQYVFVCETGIAPDGFFGFRLDSFCEFGECVDLIQRVASGECHVAEFVGLYDFEKFVHARFMTGIECP